jgi:hypothetical protein
MIFAPGISGLARDRANAGARQLDRLVTISARSLAMPY